MSQNFQPTGFRAMPPLVKNLLIINGLFFLATIVMESKGLYLTDILGWHYFQSEKFQPYQFVTYMFMHGGFMHILFNMFALWMFGSALENIWGPKRFLIYYLATGIGAILIQLIVNWFQFSNIQAAYDIYAASPSVDAYVAFMDKYFSGMYNPAWLAEVVSLWNQNPNDPSIVNQTLESAQKLITQKMNIPTVGASGAVFGILLAFGMIFPNSLIYIYFAFPVKAKYFVMAYGAIELYSGIANNPGDNVAHFAHLGGMIFGFILIKLWSKDLNRPKYF